jgi:hypothetical protein
MNHKISSCWMWSPRQDECVAINYRLVIEMRSEWGRSSVGRAQRSQC